MGCLRLEYLEFTGLRVEKNETFARRKTGTGIIVAGLNHAMHSGDMQPTDNDDEYMLTKDGKMVRVGSKGGAKTDYLYDEFTYAQTSESRTLLATADVQHSTVTTGSFSPGGYPVREGFGYRIHTQFGGHGLYDPSFDIMSNVPLSGGITLTKFGLTRLSKSAYGLSVGLGGSKTMLKSSYLFSRTPLNVSMGVRLPTIMGVSTNNLGVFLGRNSALIGAGSATYGGYNFIHKQR